MAKIRVHELAKELNMTNKAILTKLKAMNIEVKSHMSSLEDETVEQIKLNISGNKQKEHDAKAGTSVIRRRKKNKNDPPSENHATSLTKDSLSERDSRYENIIEQPLTQSKNDVDVTLEDGDDYKSVQEPKTISNTK